MALQSLPKRGRPKLGVEVHRISLRMDVYNQWLVQKDLTGMAEKTHSEFASYLLESLEEMTRLRGENQPPSPEVHGKKIYIMFSTALFLYRMFFNTINVKFINSSVFLIFLFDRPR